MATHYAIKEQDVINNLDNRLLSGLNKSTIEKIMNIILESLESDTRIVIKEIFLEKENKLDMYQLQDILEETL